MIGHALKKLSDRVYAETTRTVVNLRMSDLITSYTAGSNNRTQLVGFRVSTSDW